MKIFEHIENENFFKPLASVNRQLYCDAYDALYAATMEHVNVTEAEGRAYLGTMLSSYTALPDSYSASYVYKNLRDCGWIEEAEIGPGGKPLMVLNDKAVSLMEFLHGLTDAAESLNAGDIRTLHTHAQHLADDDAYPYRHCIAPMAQSVKTLGTALSALRRNARSVILDVVSQQSLGELVGYTRDELFESMFSEYFFIRKHGFTGQYFAEIIGWIRDFMNDPEKMKKAADEYSARHNPDALTAEEHVRDLLLTMIDFLHNQFDDLLDDIDDILDQCWRRINVQLRTYLTTGIDDRAIMADAMRYMKELPEDDVSRILSQHTDTFEVFTFDIVDESSVELIRKRKNNEEPCYLDESELTEEDLEKDTALLEADTRNNLYEAFDYVDRHMDKSGVFVPAPSNITSWDDAFALAHLLCFARAPNERYSVEYTGKTIHSDIADITGVIVTRNKEW